MGKISRDPFGLVGTIVDGRYRVERLAGQGGFGVVYRAHHLAFEAPIALKVLKLPESWPEEKKRSRTASFQREGRMLFKLSLLHPSIVRAFETGTITSAGGSIAPYLALEWLEGVSLEQELRYRRANALSPLELTQVLELLHGPATALSLAHAEGVVHRDLKPGNLFVSILNGEPVVKILDFGIAKVVRDPSEATASQQTLSAGATSSFTPMYAAPEQWLERFGATGTWTDVHAWALVCVELLTGKTPLSGREPAELMAACLNAEMRPTPRALGLELPAEVEAVFARALEIEPGRRFPDAGAFWNSLCAATKWSSRQSKEMIDIAALCANADGAGGAGTTGQTGTATSLTLQTRVTSTTATSLLLSRWTKLRSSARGRMAFTVGLGSLLLGLFLMFTSNRPEQTAGSNASSTSSSRAVPVKQTQAQSSGAERAPRQAVSVSPHQAPPASPVAATARRVVGVRTPPPPRPAPDPWDQRL